MAQAKQLSENVHPKSFEDLIREVHDMGICGRCGGCVSFCSASQIKAIDMQINGPPRYVNKEACLKCGLCYLICPQVEVLNEELNTRYEFKEPIGHVANIYSAQATDETIRGIATDGGVVTALLQTMLAERLIDGALVCHSTGAFQRIPLLATTPEDLNAAAGTHIEIVGQVPELGDYNTFIPVVSQLRSLITEDLQSIAVVGVPCQVHSIRKMQELNIIPAHVVKYIIGLYCYENFYFDDRTREVMEQKFGFGFNDVQKMNIKEDLVLTLNGQAPLHIAFDDLTDFMRPACQACKDFSNYYADISVGGLGSPEGFTSVLVRTEKGKSMYALGLRREAITEPANLNTSIKKSSMMAQVIGFSQRKQKRAEQFLQKIENLLISSRSEAVEQSTDDFLSQILGDAPLDVAALKSEIESLENRLATNEFYRLWDIAELKFSLGLVYYRLARVEQDPTLLKKARNLFRDVLESDFRTSNCKTPFLEQLVNKCND